MSSNWIYILMVTGFFAIYAVITIENSKLHKKLDDLQALIVRDKKAD